MATTSGFRCQQTVVSFLLLLGLCFQSTFSANILFFLPFGSISHIHSITPLMENLGLRGHNITYLTMVRPKTTFKNNIKVFHMKQLDDLYERIRPNSFDMMEIELMEVMDLMTLVANDMCESMLTSEQFEHIVQDKSTHYDVIVMDNLMSECGLSIVPLLGNPPFIFFCTTTIYDWTAMALDIPVPFAYVPTLFLPQNPQMTFTSRLLNTLVHLGYRAFRKFFIFPTTDKVVQKHWPGLPRLEDIEKNVSLVLTNSHSQSLDIVRPTAPFFIEVGGTHCRPSKKLNKELEDFFDQSGSNGFIYFSMGTNIKGNEMSPNRISSFIDAFRRLKQRVLWKFESNMTDLPANVKITPWVPQQDVLGHPNIRLFISHGGQLSTQEAIYHGVPVLGLPLGWDQIINLDSGISKGYARKLFYANFSSDDIYEQITEMLSNKSYKKKAEYYSSLIRDRPQDPLDTATFWVEFVIRHQRKTNEYLRFNGARNLNFFQYFLLDVAALVVVVFIIILLIPYHLGKGIFRKLRARKQSLNKKMQ